MPVDEIHESNPQTEMDVDDDNDGADHDSDVYDDNDSDDDNSIDKDTDDTENEDSNVENNTPQPVDNIPVPEVVPYKPILDTGWLGPYPLDEFFSHFLPPAPSPCPSVSKDHFNAMPANVPSKRDMYKPFVQLVEKDEDTGRPSLLPGLRLVDRSNTPYRRNSIKLISDLVVYKRNVNMSKNSTQFDGIELELLFKKDDSAEPFASDPESDFEAPGEASAACRKKLLTYLKELSLSHHRPFAFCVFLGDPWIRFLRWDIGGVLVTERFNYREDSKYLVEFLWRFAHMSDAERGCDDPNFAPKWEAKTQTITPIILGLNKISTGTQLHELTSIKEIFTGLAESTKALHGLTWATESVHGDVSPWNIIRSTDGSFYLNDWDTARHDPTSAESIFTTQSSARQYIIEDWFNKPGVKEQMEEFVATRVKNMNQAI